MQFVFFGNDWFAENRTSSHHISKRIAAKFPLLYVEVPGLRAPKVNSRDIRKVLQKLRLALQPPQQIGPHFWRMTLPQIPFKRFKAVRGLNQMISRWMLHRAISRLGFTETVAWFHIPHPGHLAGVIGEKATVFYVTDDHSKLANADSASIAAMDEALTKASDLVFTCNADLRDKRLPFNGNIEVSSHGVDAELFALASAAETTVPEELKDLAHPVVGSWGLIDQRVDLSIIEHIARARPEWTMLLIGRVAVDVSGLNGLPNVIFTGPKPYSELPHWAKPIDVCILPYVQSPLVLQSSPLKLREYLASGKPLITVPMPEVNAFSDVVKIESDGAGFVTAIESTLATDTSEMATLRQNAIQGNTWDAAVARMLGSVERVLNEKASPAGPIGT